MGSSLLAALRGGSGSRGIIAAGLVFFIFWRLGWLIARGLVGRLRGQAVGLDQPLDARIPPKGWKGLDEQPLRLEDIIVKFVYYLIVFIAILAAFLNCVGSDRRSPAMFTGVIWLICSGFLPPRVIYAADPGCCRLVVAKLLRAGRLQLFAARRGGG